jgi:hypothetical protein
MTVAVPLASSRPFAVRRSAYTGKRPVWDPPQLAQLHPDSCVSILPVVLGRRKGGLSTPLAAFFLPEASSRWDTQRGCCAGPRRAVAFFTTEAIASDILGGALSQIRCEQQQEFHKVSHTRRCRESYSSAANEEHVKLVVVCCGAWPSQTAHAGPSALPDRPQCPHEGRGARCRASQLGVSLPWHRLFQRLEDIRLAAPVSVIRCT